MALMNASEVARVLGKTDKTVRQWVKDGKLHAVHISSRELGIDVREVQRLAKHIGVDLPEQDIDQAARIAQLEHEIAMLKVLYDGLNSNYETLKLLLEKTIEAPGSTRPILHIAEQQQAAASPIEPAIELPNMSVDVHTFALQHGISRGTVKHHYAHGLDGELLQCTALPVPNRPGQFSRSLTGEQQAAAIAYWERHAIRSFTECSQCPHDEQQAAS